MHRRCTEDTQIVLFEYGVGIAQTQKNGMCNKNQESQCANEMGHDSLGRIEDHRSSGLRKFTQRKRKWLRADIKTDNFKIKS